VGHDGGFTGSGLADKQHVKKPICLLDAKADFLVAEI
jgi:hypothetical protein